MDDKNAFAASLYRCGYVEFTAEDLQVPTILTVYDLELYFSGRTNRAIQFTIEQAKTQYASEIAEYSRLRKIGKVFYAELQKAGDEATYILCGIPISVMSNVYDKERFMPPYFSSFLGLVGHPGEADPDTVHFKGPIGHESANPDTHPSLLSAYHAVCDAIQTSPVFGPVTHEVTEREQQMDQNVTDDISALELKVGRLVVQKSLFSSSAEEKAAVDIKLADLTENNPGLIDEILAAGLSYSVGTGKANAHTKTIGHTIDLAYEIAQTICSHYLRGPEQRVEAEDYIAVHLGSDKDIGDKRACTYFGTRIAENLIKGIGIQLKILEIRQEQELEAQWLKASEGDAIYRHITNIFDFLSGQARSLPEDEIAKTIGGFLRKMNKRYLLEINSGDRPRPPPRTP